MKIRRATAEDATACATIVSNWFETIDWMPDPPGHETLQTMLRNGLRTREAWIAQTEEDILCYLSLDPETAHIHGLYTARPGSGTGRALIARANRGRDYLQLLTHAPNTAAHRFYAREGFEITDRDVAGDDGVRQFAMEWTR